MSDYPFDVSDNEHDYRSGARIGWSGEDGAMTTLFNPISGDWF